MISARNESYYAIRSPLAMGALLTLTMMIVAAIVMFLVLPDVRSTADYSAEWLGPQDLSEWSTQKAYAECVDRLEARLKEQGYSTDTGRSETTQQLYDYAWKPLKHLEFFLCARETAPVSKWFDTTLAMKWWDIYPRLIFSVLLIAISITFIILTMIVTYSYLGWVTYFAIAYIYSFSTNRFIIVSLIFTTLSYFLLGFKNRAPHLTHLSRFSTHLLFTMVLLIWADFKYGDNNWVGYSSYGISPHTVLKGIHNASTYASTLEEHPEVAFYSLVHRLSYYFVSFIHFCLGTINVSLPVAYASSVLIMLIHQSRPHVIVKAVPGLRGRIRSLPPPKNTYHEPSDGHTHPNSARKRASLEKFVNDLMGHFSLGFSIGCGADHWDGVDDMYSVKSAPDRISRFNRMLQTPFEFIAWWYTDPTKWLIFRNSDYYFNIETFMFICRNMIVLNHDVTRLGGRNDEATFSMKNNELTMTVNGGARYKHKVNRYDTDIMSTRMIGPAWFSPIARFVLAIFGFNLLFVYDVHYFTQDDYNVTILTPRHIINTARTPHLEIAPEHHVLETHYETEDVKLNALVIQRMVEGKTKLDLVVSPPNSDQSVSIEWASFLGIVACVQRDSDIRDSAIVHKLNNLFGEVDAEHFRPLLLALVPHADLLYDRRYVMHSLEDFKNSVKKYHYNYEKGAAPDIDVPPDVNVTNFVKKMTKQERKDADKQYKEFIKKYGCNFSSFHLAEGQDHPAYTAAMQQIFPLLIRAPVCVPCKNDYADRDAYQGRLLAANLDTEQFRKQTVIDWDLIERIVKAIFPQVLTPMSGPELEQYCEANVKLRKRYAEHMEQNKGCDQSTTAADGTANFVKVEAQTKDPSCTSNRNITNDASTLVVLMTAYTKVLSTALILTVPGYAFGQSVADLATFIHLLAMAYCHVVETDYSSFDGTQNTITFLIEWITYSTAFGKEGAFDILWLKYLSFNAKVKGTGFLYGTRGTRHSGAADTSIMNSIINIIITTYARATHPSQKDIPIEELLKMSVAGGDDGLAFNMDADLAKHYEETAKLFGLKLKAELKTTSQPLNMLARIYPCPKAHPGSGVDIKRMFLKITHGLNEYGANYALALKICGYITTDYKTPVVIEFLNQVVRTLSPFIDQNVINKLKTGAEIAYSARLGQPIPVDDPETYLLANDQEAVEAMIQATKELSQVKYITDWKPGFFTAPEVGDYNNDDFTSKKISNATNKLSTHHEYGPDYNSLPQDVKNTMMNGFVTRKLTEIYKATFSNMKIMDFSMSPDMVLNYLKTLNSDSTTQKDLNHLAPSKTFVIINLPFRLEGLYDKILKILTNAGEGCYFVINAHMNHRLTTAPFYNYFEWNEVCAGNNVVLLHGKRDPRTTKVRPFSQKQLMKPPDPQHMNHSALLQVPGLPTNVVTSIQQCASKAQNVKHHKGYGKVINTPNQVKNGNNGKNNGANPGNQQTSTSTSPKQSQKQPAKPQSSANNGNKDGKQKDPARGDRFKKNAAVQATHTLNPDGSITATPHLVTQPTPSTPTSTTTTTTTTNQPPTTNPKTKEVTPQSPPPTTTPNQAPSSPPKTANTKAADPQISRTSSKAHDETTKKSDKSTPSITHHGAPTLVVQPHTNSQTFETMKPGKVQGKPASGGAHIKGHGDPPTPDHIVITLRDPAEGV